MGDQHGAFILYLAVSLLQGLQGIQGTMGSAEDSFRHPSGGNDLNPLCLQAFQQRIPADPQGIRPQGKNRLPVIEGAKCFGFLIAEFLDPALHHPLWMTIFQGQMLCLFSLARREFRLFRLPHCGSQNGIHELHGACMAVFLREFHGLIAGSGIGHPVHVKDLIYPQTEDFPYHGRNLFQGTIHIAAQDPVQCLPRLHRPIGQFRRKTPVCLCQFAPAQFLHQCHIGICPLLMHRLQDLRRHFPRLVHSIPDLIFRYHDFLQFRLYLFHVHPCIITRTVGPDI